MAKLTLRRAPWRAPTAPLFDRPFGSIGNLDRMVESLFDRTNFPEAIGMAPAVDISETDDTFVCTIELPGMKQEDVQVLFEDGSLTIKGEKHDEREEKNKRMHVWERSYGTFERSFTFPGEVNPDKISAEFNNGVLTVTLPKARDGKTTGRTIPVKST